MGFSKIRSPSGSLLLLQLERLSRQLFPHQAITGPAEVDDVMRVLRRFYRENQLFSYWQFPLADRATDATAVTGLRPDTLSVMQDRLRAQAFRACASSRCRPHERQPQRVLA